MGLGATPRPHHITWDHRAGYRASHRHAADTTHSYQVSLTRPASVTESLIPSPSGPGNPVILRAARVATGWCAASVSPTIPVRAILPLAYRAWCDFGG